MVRDLRVHQILEGTNEIMRLIVARRCWPSAHERDPTSASKGRAGRITLNRPQALNALTYDMCRRSRRAGRLGARRRGGGAGDHRRRGRQGVLRGRRHRRDVPHRHARAISPMAATVLARRIPDERQARFHIPSRWSPSCRASPWAAAWASAATARTGSWATQPDRHARMRHRAGAGCGRLADPGPRAGAAGRISRHSPAARMGRATRSMRALPITTCPRRDGPLKAELARPAIGRPSTARPPPRKRAGRARPEIDRFSAANPARHPDRAAATAGRRHALKAMARNAPLSMACAVEMIHRLRGPATTIRARWSFEYRFTWRAMEHGDFLEGIRAAIIDKDRTPRWRTRSAPCRPPHRLADADAAGRRRADI
jgi:enoyl-CoA hydratase